MTALVLITGGLFLIALLTIIGAFVCSAVLGDSGVLIGGLGAPIAVGCAMGGPGGGVFVGVVALVVLAILMLMGESDGTEGHDDDEEPPQAWVIPR